MTNLVILAISSVDRSLNMELHEVHSLSALHPDLGLQFFYIQEGQYIAISKHWLYATIPTEHDNRICMATEDCLCLLNQAFLHVEAL